MAPYRTFIVQYRHKTSRYAVTILAQDEQDAQDRVNALRSSAALLRDAPHINRKVDSLSIDTWNAAVNSIIQYLDKLTLDPLGLPVADPMLVAPIMYALAKNIRERYEIGAPKPSQEAAQ